MPRRLVALVAMLLLAACGGGGGGSSGSGSGSGSGSTPVVTPTVNTATVSLDAGPAALRTGSGGYSAFNTPYVTVTVCAPGSTTNCQVIDHVILDTGSVGLRLLAPVLNAGLLAALPSETSGGDPVAECYQYVNSYAFGSVRQADFSIAGEKVAGMPVQVIADGGTFAAVPGGCSSGGGTQITSVQDFGANGILGVGTTQTDCGSYCAVAGGSSAASYYSCPATGCATVIARAANASAPFEQLPNPVAAFAADNNGVILALPSVPQAGSATITGTVTFGIGTQADNALAKSAVVLPLTTSASRLGPGVLSVAYNGKTLTQSFLDSGSNEYFFIDTTLPPCTDSSLTAFYCPAPSLLLSPVLTATDGTSVSGAFTLYSPLNVTGTSTAAPGIGVNPTLVTPPLPFANSFDFGLPFFFGRTVYTAIEGRAAGGVAGPFVAF